MMEHIYASDPRFWGSTDSETIQNAIDFAAETGAGMVIIPRENARTGQKIWIIDRAILLPSDITVILEGAHLRLADGVRENIFRNQNAWTPEGNTLTGEQHDIRLIGVGHAVLDGGEPNGLCEQLHRDHPDEYPHMQVNLLVFLHNVRHFEVRGIQFIDSRWWATCFMFCRWGHIADLDFRMYGTLENQDGIDLRIGCEYITIENITGLTGDDTIALTALPYVATFERLLWVEGKTFDIHDITIRNVIASSHGCALLRFLNCDGAKAYNITVTDLKDTGLSIAYAAILFGTGHAGGGEQFYGIRPHSMGEFKNVTVRGVTTCAQLGLSLCEPCENVRIEGLVTYGKNEVGLKFNPNFAAKNMVIRDCTFDAEPETADSIFIAPGCTDEALADLRIEDVRVGEADYVFRCRKLEVKDFVCAEPRKGWFTPENARLCSAYGRYHRYSYGKEITNRPPDNRFAAK